MMQNTFITSIIVMEYFTLLLCHIRFQIGKITLTEYNNKLFIID